MKLKLKTFIIGVLIFITFISFSLFINTFKANAQTITFSSEIKSEYYFNEKITIPTAKITDNDGTQTLTHRLYYPNGRVSDMVINELDVIGTYLLKYYDGNEEYTSIEFKVVLGKNDSLFTNINNTNINSNVNANEWADIAFNGVEIRTIGSLGHVAYNGIVDLNKPEFSYFIDLLPNAFESEKKDINAINIKLTDVFNNDNYLTIRLLSGDNFSATGRVTYVSTSACGMYDNVGLEWTLYEGKPWIQTAGTGIKTSFHGKPSSWNNITSSTRIYYDVVENALYASASHTNYDYDAYFQKTDETGRDWRCVLDYDNPDMVGHSNIWNGFTSNYVYLDISVENYALASNPESSLLILSCNGNDLSGDKCLSTRDVFFVTDYEGYDEDDLPKGVIGGSYKVFDTNAYDNYGNKIENLGILVKDPDGDIIPVVNGRFDTKKAGEYTIKYLANSSTVINQKEISISVVNETPNWSFDIIQQETLTYNKEIKIEQGNLVGPSGKVDRIIKVYFENEEIETFNVDDEVYFYPKTPGEYVVKYSFTDFVGIRKDFEKNITIEISSCPIMTEPNVCLKNIIGKKVDLPVVASKIFINGSWLYLPVEVYFDDQNISSEMCYMPTTLGLHKITYKSVNPQDETLATIYEFEVCVEDADNRKYFMDDFFMFDGFISSNVCDENDTSANSYYLIADGNKNNAKAIFVKPISDRILSVELCVSQSYHDFKNLFIEFIDSVDSNKKIELKLQSQKPYGEQNESKIRLWINGNDLGFIEGSFESNTSNTFIFNYDYSSKSIKDSDGNILYNIKTFANGDIFNGFCNGKATISFEIDQVKSKSVIEVKKISNQVISSKLKRDNISPLVILDESFVETRNMYVGETIIVKPFEAFDVLSDQITQNLLITKGKDTVYNGLLDEEIMVNLNELGTYVFEVAIKDSSGNANSKIFVVNVCRFEYSGLKILDSFSSAKLNENVVLPEFETIGDVSQVYIYVEDAVGVRRYATIDKGDNRYHYIFEKKGTYNLGYVVVSTCGLTTMYEWEVEVK